jgi:hypothetical protein
MRHFGRPNGGITSEGIEFGVFWGLFYGSAEKGSKTTLDWPWELR